jgi:hypothetical protein
MRRALLVLGLLGLWAAPAHGMKLNLLQGQTCANAAPRPCLVGIFIQDSSSTIGAGLAGLTNASAGLVCYYARSDQGNAAATQHTLGAATRGTWSATSNFVEKDATNMPGVYELSLVTAMLAANATWVIVECRGATNMAPMLLEIALTNYDPQDSVRLGLTALPNAAAGANTGLPVVGTQVPNATAGASAGLLISGSNAGTTTLGALTVTGATTQTGNVILSDGLTISAPSTANRAGITVTGNGTGAGFSLTSGNGATGNAFTLLAASTNGHGLSSTGVGTGDGIRGVAGASGVDLRSNLTGNVTGNLSGSVGSVTGAVGSVTGAVGSVTGAVGSVTGNVGGNVVGSVASVTARVTANADQWAGTTIPAPTVAGEPLVDVVLWRGTLPSTLNSGSVQADVQRWVNAVPNALINSRVPIAAQVQQNVARASHPFMMTDSTTHAPRTGVTATCTRSIDGAAFAAGTLANVTEVANGFYRVDFGAGDLNGASVILRCTGLNADDTFVQLETFP